MGNLLVILAVLFLVLVVVIPLIEKYAPREEGRSFGGITKFLFPLLALALILQLFRHYFF
ncbi:MAG: hypothetical protein KGY54_08890 [Oleiphilaceae bacterium]|nr:hypothetical protein [Oleiphilaceae bacterium]